MASGVVSLNENSAASSESFDARREKLMRVGRVAWLVLAAISLITFFAGFRAWVQFLANTPWLFYLVPQVTQDGIRQMPLWSSETFNAALAGLGSTSATFTGIQITLALGKFLIFTAFGIILFIKKPNNSFALYTSLLMVLSGTFYGFAPVFPTIPWLGIADSLIRFAVAIGIFTLAYLFPDGHFVPRWAKWIVIAWMIIFPLAYGFVLFMLQAPREFLEGFFWLEFVTLLIMLLAFIALSVGLVAAQIYRYRAVSTPSERQQSKWFAYAVLFYVTELIVMSVLPYFFPLLASASATGLAFAILRDIANTLAWVVLPLAIAVAILRYRLWDIDLLINRTLVYVPLTAILAGVFTVVSSFTQKAFLALAAQPTDQSSEAATVLTTLIVVAIFDPLRKLISDFVDRHFKELPDPLKELKAYRSKVELVLQVMDRQEIARQTLSAIAKAYDTASAALILEQNESAKPIHTVGEWNGDCHLRVPLVLDDGTVLGRIELGARKKGREFTDDDRRVLEANLDLVERALVLAQWVQARHG